MNSSANELYSLAVNQRTNIQLSANFDLKQMVTTSQDVDNWPKSVEVVWYLHMLCWYVLQPIRNQFNQDLKVTSGYRSKALNTMIGGSTTSQHSKGQAADFEITGVDNNSLAQWIDSNLAYDQLILEFYKSKEGVNSGWVHCSYKPTGRRKQFLVAQKSNGKTQYLPATTARLGGL